MSLSSSPSSKGLLWRAAALFLGDFLRLDFVGDLRLEVGGPIFGIMGVGFVEDLDVDAVDVVALDGFDGILVVG